MLISDDCSWWKSGVANTTTTMSECRCSKCRITRVINKIKAERKNKFLLCCDEVFERLSKTLREEVKNGISN